MLASSYKNGNRCIAGKELIAGSPTVGQYGEWIRPIGPGQGGSVPERVCRCEDGSIAKVGDLVSIPGCACLGDPNQPENWSFAHNQIWAKHRKLSWHEISLLGEKPDSLWLDPYENRSDRIAPRRLAELHGEKPSLYLIRPDRIIEFTGDNRNGRWTKTKLTFAYNGTTYKMSITDPNIIARLQGPRPLPPFIFAPGGAMLVVSLTPPFSYDGKRYKVAASMFPTEGAN